MMSATELSRVKDIYLPQKATVTEIYSMTATEKFFRFHLEEGEALPYMPGQFMEVSVPGFGEAPISISSSPTRTDDTTFEMVIRKAGNVTTALHALVPGEPVGLRGPYGTHFPVEESMKGKDIVFVCGGIGLVPVRSAIHYVLDHRENYGQVTILSGTRSPEDRLFTEELYEWKTRSDVNFLETVDTADKRWGGTVGVITTLLKQVHIDPTKTVVVICGPPIMYKFVLLELRKLNVDINQIYVSLERHMRCAVGKCGHCQINGLYACQKGAVFNYADIVDVREAI